MISIREARIARETLVEVSWNDDPDNFGWLGTVVGIFPDAARPAARIEWQGTDHPEPSTVPLAELEFTQSARKVVDKYVGDEVTSVDFYRNTNGPQLMAFDELRSLVASVGLPPDRINEDMVAVVFDGGEGSRAVWYGNGWHQIVNDLRDLLGQAEALAEREEDMRS